MTDDSYEGPTEIGHFTMPGRGTSYSFDISGHKFQICISEKRKLVRVFVDNKDWAPA